MCVPKIRNSYILLIPNLPPSIENPHPQVCVFVEDVLIKYLSPNCWLVNVMQSRINDPLQHIEEISLSGFSIPQENYIRYVALYGL